MSNRKCSPDYDDDATPRQALARIALVAMASLAIAGCAGTQRPTPPPSDAEVTVPWGAVSDTHLDSQVNDEFRRRIVTKMRDKVTRDRAESGDDSVIYRALTLSGGGSGGAYGVGIMSGWTARGDRPEFDVVTGISTGALMATHVFLGPEFDEHLSVYTSISNDDVFRTKSKLGALRSDSMFDTAPLRRLLASIITPAILDRVAAEYAKGRLLFIGTTNLDADDFTIWDMGAIAASDREDKLEHYIDVVMASASVPIVFPPVYIEVEGENGRYTQMHVDGGVQQTAFFFDFVADRREAIEELGIGDEDLHIELYLLNNSPVSYARQYRPVEGRTMAIAEATVYSFLNKVTLTSIYRIWVLAMASGADFNMTSIPGELQGNAEGLDFDPDRLRGLYDYGYNKMLDRTAWLSQRAPGDSEELLKRLVAPARGFQRSGAPFLLGPGER